MANLLLGIVFYNNQFTGYLKQEAGDRYSFTYDISYLNASKLPISYTLPLREEPYLNEQELHPYFDNLVAEGWLENAQIEFIGKRTCSRFELLLAFGTDLAGAVTVIDPEPAKLHPENTDQSDPKNLAVYKNRASLSGIQPKVFLISEKHNLRIANLGEHSTHIAKLPSETINDITYNEWITLCVCKALIPEDDFVEAKLKEIEILGEVALLIKRFDRINNKKIHFEEFNQLLNLQSIAKYDGSYADMANFIYNSKNCLEVDVYRLFKRILVALFTGNTDMHFKNFSMLYTESGLRLSPNYDQVAAAIYKRYQIIALKLDNDENRKIGDLKPKNIIALGKEFLLKDDVIMMAIDEIEARLDTAKEVAFEACKSHIVMRDDIIKFMERRWKGTFSLIGQRLSKKQ